MKLNIFSESFKIFESIDIIISRIIKIYEKNKFGLNKLKDDIANNIELANNEYIFEIIEKDKKFIIDYNIYVKNKILNINIEFFEGGEFLFFKYNDILIVSNEGVIEYDVTYDFLKLIKI